ncbi:putative mitochondrial carrier protein [Babesia bovis T2Bo]|uniref:Mitochondrial carrier protein, putative n=2 Tax=Babesia bovis TaxID=5865 RepID=A7ATY3_BABBO|nr:putative mitochondrial carrier protein [Babesia bovis T2Bo]EDO06394.1 putative mitochondrial carrier protein [Babesia bovis T2Bo]|eukprot:XP_001609962.1 mitochondrial carrier protein [Babesia bovis T2Bo]
MDSSESTHSGADTRKILKGTMIGGVMVSSICVPTDVIRNYWYFNPALKGRRGNVSTLGVARQIYARHGFRSFFTGFNITLFNVIGGQTIFFLVYDNLKVQTSSPVASVLGRMATLFVMQPFECLRTYKQANLTETTSSYISGTRGVQKYLSLYRGLTTTIIRDVPFSAIHWPVNDWLYRQFITMRGISVSDLSKRERLWISLVTGSMSSVLACTISQPFDIVKTKIQATTDRSCKRTTSSELRRFFGQYGFRGFFIGLTPRLLKVVPGCAIISGCHRYFN